MSEIPGNWRKFSDFRFYFTGDALKIFNALKAEDSPLRSAHKDQQHPPYFFIANHEPEDEQARPSISYDRLDPYAFECFERREIEELKRRVGGQQLSAKLEYTRGDLVTTVDDIKNIKEILHFLRKKEFNFFIVVFNDEETNVFITCKNELEPLLVSE